MTPKENVSSNIFTPRDLEQIKELAEHMKHNAPGITPEGLDVGERLKIEVTVFDGTGRPSVKIQVYPAGDPLITFLGEST